MVARIVTDAFKPATLESNSSVEEGANAKLTITDPDANFQDQSENPAMPQSQTNTGDFALILTDAEQAGGPLDHPAATALYEYAPFTLPITWGAVAGTVIWRGRVRSQWSKQGYDYDTFKLITKMRGSPTRQKLLEAVKNEQKNKLQLANELGVDWKTIDNHVGMLLEARLIEEKDVVGTARYYAITESGARVLTLLASSELGNSSSSKADGGDKK